MKMGSNRLIREKSPYLLQHAHNPVDWYPWGDEAFKKAQREDKPVFLSIGYSTCHWCHVMERESFEDEEVAKILKDQFVSVKVDREERPDVDAIYMSVCQALTGSGGWPLTIVMTPDQKPFYAGTYFSKYERFGRPGLMTLLPQLSELWKTHRPKLEGSAGQITEMIRQEFRQSRQNGALTVATLERGFQQLRGGFDGERGGFSRAPKFPTPHHLTFLLRWWFRSRNSEALAMVEKTLEEMRKGGIFDHVGFGFHRYSTDPRWLVPHFEKMLYDQAEIALAALETYQATGKPLYADIAGEIFEYVLRDLTDSQGGFYSAEDADSEGVEGKFYVWTKEEILGVLGREEGDFYCGVCQISEEGNFTDESEGEGHPSNIPHWREIPDGATAARLENSRKKLFQVREKRAHPYKDDKILTDWNGLMIAALAKGAQVLRRPAYAEAAVRAAGFILKALRGKNGRLWHRYRSGESGLTASLDDYAFLVWGLIELYGATFDVSYLREATTLTEAMIALFWDDAQGGFFLTAMDHENLIARPKSLYDGALPSGNSVAAMNLLRLGRLTANPTFDRCASKLLEAFSGSAEEAPSAYTQFLQAVDFELGPTREIVIAGNPGTLDTQVMLKAVQQRFLPRTELLLSVPNDEGLSNLAPFTREQGMMNGKATAYVCENHACRTPTTKVDELLDLTGDPTNSLLPKQPGQEQGDR